MTSAHQAKKTVWQAWRLHDEVYESLLVASTWSRNKLPADTYAMKMTCVHIYNPYITYTQTFLFQETNSNSTTHPFSTQIPSWKYEFSSHRSQMPQTQPSNFFEKPKTKWVPTIGCINIIYMYYIPTPKRKSLDAWNAPVSFNVPFVCVVIFVGQNAKHMATRKTRGHRPRP